MQSEMAAFFFVFDIYIKTLGNYIQLDPNK